MVGKRGSGHRTGRQRLDRLRLMLPRRARRSRGKAVGAMPPLMRRMMILVVVALIVSGSLGGRWHSQRGGDGARIAFVVARTICPTEARFTKRASVAAGAHAIDRAALRRLGDLVSSGSKCTALPRRSGLAG
jgi:hypothetical protein